jgi:hypothetical protein
MTTKTGVGDFGMHRVMEDDRPIDCISLNPEGFFKVGVLGTEKIEAYGEAGEMAQVPWFAVWKDGVISQRVNGKYVDCVTYAEVKP